MLKYWKIALAVALGLALMAGVVWAATQITISGTVTDAYYGKAISGATVEATGAITDTDTTDAFGYYELVGLIEQDGTVNVKVTVPASNRYLGMDGVCSDKATETEPQSVYTETQEYDLDFEMTVATSTATLWGYVYSCETGEGIAGAEVSLTGTAFETTTAADGYYAFCEPIPAGEYEVCAEAAGFEKVCKQWDTEEDPAELNFTGKNCLPPTPPPPPEIPVVQVPVIYMDGGWETWIQVQNVGDEPTKVVMELWPESDGSCQPQTYDKVECSGELQPGAAWTWKLSEDYPGTGSRSAIIYSVVPGTEPTDCFGDGTLVGGEPIAVTVQRTQTAPGADEDYRSSVYNGIPDWVYYGFEFGPDPVTKAYMYYAPLVFNDGGGYGWVSDIWIQNSGDECTSVEIWYHSTCEEWEIAQVLALHPSKSVLAPKPSWTGIGSAWIRSSQPLGIVVDHQDAAKTKLLSYTAFPVEYWYEDLGYDIGPGTWENYGPLIYREYNGWDSGVQVQNMDSTTNALVKVYFLDASGDIITTLVDWICKRCSQTFFLPAINNLPGNYVGQFRVHSQNWRTPGDPTVYAPEIMSVVNLINYNTGQGLSYNALPAWAAWWEQIPSLGVTQLALPFLTKQKHDPFEPTGATWTSKIALTNLVHMSYFNDVVVRIDFFDQNGLLYSICEKLNPKDVNYIDLDNYGVIPPGWLGSAVITVQCTPPVSVEEGVAAIGAVVVNQAEGYASGDLTTGYTAIPIDWGLPVWWEPPGPDCIECITLD